MLRPLKWVLVLLGFVVLVGCSNDNGSPATAPASLPTISFANGSAASRTQGPSAPTAESPTQPIATTAAGATRAPTIAYPTSESLAGNFVMSAGDGSIWLVNAASGSASNIIPSTPGQFASAPIFSLDGQEIIFVLGVIDPEGKGHDSIRARKLDGTGERIILELEDASISFNFPTLSPDGARLYFTSNLPLPDGGRRNDIQRLSLANNSIETIIQDGRQQSVSADGAHLTFIRLDADSFTASLWISDGDGVNERQLLASDVFDIIYAPRFSPDGSSIVFAASGPNKKPLPGLTSSHTCDPLLLCLLASRAAAKTDGLAWDLYSVTPDGAKFTRLTNIGADSPYPAWSRDGRLIGMLTQRGMFVYDAASNQVFQLNSIGAHGNLDWWQPP